jgi:hypothetical protein
MIDVNRAWDLKTAIEGVTEFKNLNLLGLKNH